MSKKRNTPPPAGDIQPINAAATTLVALELLTVEQRIQVLQSAIAFFGLTLADGRLRA